MSAIPPDPDLRYLHRFKPFTRAREQSVSCDADLSGEDQASFCSQIIGQNIAPELEDEAAQIICEAALSLDDSERALMAADAIIKNKMTVAEAKQQLQTTKEQIMKQIRFRNANKHQFRARLSDARSTLMTMLKKFGLLGLMVGVLSTAIYTAGGGLFKRSSQEVAWSKVTDVS